MNTAINQIAAAILASVEEILGGGSPDTVPAADAMSFYAALPAHGNGGRDGGGSSGGC